MIGNNFNNINYDSPHFKQSVGFSVDALNWKASIVANGGTITNNLLKTFDDYFFKPCKANGNILNQLDRLNIYCGLNGFPIAARTNMITNNFGFVTPVNAPTFDNLGYKSVGTGYLNLNYNPSVNAVKFQNTDNIFGCVVVIDEYASGNRATIGANTGPNNTYIDRLSTGTIQFYNKSNIAANDITQPTGKVFLATRKTSATAGTIIINATQTAAVFTNFPTTNLSHFELSRNSSGTPVANFDQKYHYCSFHGSASLDWTNFRIILNNLFARLGV